MTKSKSRIAEFGEVFTSEREVKAMLDLVEAETCRIDSRFLEPACGDGNFLIEVLFRKLALVSSRYSKNQLDYERNAFLAISSLYGVDILQDNVEQCRARLFSFFNNEYHERFTQVNDRFLGAVRFVITRNILHGDALSLELPGSNAPIIFSEWCFVSGSRIQRKDYALNNLIAYQPFEDDNLFSDLGEQAFIPPPIQVYPVMHFMDLADD